LAWLYSESSFNATLIWTVKVWLFRREFYFEPGGKKFDWSIQEARIWNE
jgi:hypothetical protein